MYLTRAILRNIRGFENLELDFKGESGAPRLTTLILGRNATCKTSVLRAIALSLSDLSGASALLEAPNGGFVRKGTKQAEIDVWLVNAAGQPWEGGDIHLIITGQGEREYLTTGLPQPIQDLFACGYGVGRWGFGARTQKRTYRVSDSLGQLFNYGTPLADPELTLRR